MNAKVSSFEQTRIGKQFLSTFRFRCFFSIAPGLPDFSLVQQSKI
jgi:hypothetical protein